MTEKSPVKKNDFIQIEFTGKANGQIFDTTNPKEAKALGIDAPKDIKPLIICAGNAMMLKGLDEQLEGKELDKKYTLTVPPQKAFGLRNTNLIKTYGLQNFRKNDINPYQGMTLQLDNQLVKVISVSGGRVTVDFNNPLAGKEVEYSFTITKKIIDDLEKINALQDFFFRKRFEFTIYDKKVLFKDPIIKPLLELLAPQWKSMTGFDFEAPETIKQEKKTQK